jgi:hypothetical protein
VPRRHDFCPLRRARTDADKQDILFRLTSDWMDMMLMMLLVSPLVWEHHYVLAIPPFLWGLINATRRRLFWILLGGGLLFTIPVFDIYPLSYYRLVGMLILTAATHQQISRKTAACEPPVLIQMLRSLAPKPPQAKEETP